MDPLCSPAAEYIRLQKSTNPTRRTARGLFMFPAVYMCECECVCVRVCMCECVSVCLLYAFNVIYNFWTPRCVFKFSSSDVSSYITQCSGYCLLPHPLSPLTLLCCRHTCSTAISLSISNAIYEKRQRKKSKKKEKKRNTKEKQAKVVGKV